MTKKTTTQQNDLITFEVGKTYSCLPESWSMQYTVIKRTAKTVTVKPRDEWVDAHNTNPRTFRVKIAGYGERRHETFKPEGHYTGSPLVCSYLLLGGTPKPQPAPETATPQPEQQPETQTQHAKAIMEEYERIISNIRAKQQQPTQPEPQQEQKKPEQPSDIMTRFEALAKDNSYVKLIIKARELGIPNYQDMTELALDKAVFLAECARRTANAQPHKRTRTQKPNDYTDEIFNQLKAANSLQDIQSILANISYRGLQAICKAEELRAKRGITKEQLAESISKKIWGRFSSMNSEGYFFIPAWGIMATTCSALTHARAEYLKSQHALNPEPQPEVIDVEAHDITETQPAITAPALPARIEDKPTPAPNHCNSKPAKPQLTREAIDKCTSHEEIVAFLSNFKKSEISSFMASIGIHLGVMGTAKLPVKLPKLISYCAAKILQKRNAPQQPTTPNTPKSKIYYTTPAPAVKQDKHGQLMFIFEEEAQRAQHEVITPSKKRAPTPARRGKKRCHRHSVKVKAL